MSKSKKNRLPVSVSDITYAEPEKKKKPRKRNVPLHIMMTADERAEVRAAELTHGMLAREVVLAAVREYSDPNSISLQLKALRILVADLAHEVSRLVPRGEG